MTSLYRNPPDPPDRDDSMAEELRKIRVELTALRKLFDPSAACT